ncbi:hypothetical protein T10_10250 [Trichinella papuae]|uniref:Uncharacterized protein n=1 Tax=Trichinella papuae TaxID=268474 RepID=A0A0V1N874_9BILA|nr:hypothetical protein T10_10250 [Trichinella papuae]
MKLRKKHDESFIASFAEPSRLIHLHYACELIPQPCCLKIPNFHYFIPSGIAFRGAGLFCYPVFD